jgi:hypothetical protein
MIDSTIIKEIYVGDGETTQFPFSFPYISTDDVKVAIYDIETEMEETLESDYYVDGVANKVLYPGYPPGEEPPESMQPGPLPVGKKLIVYRSTPINQLKDLGDKYPLPIIEEMVDKNNMILQEMDEKVSRAILVEMGDGMTPEDFSYDLKNLKNYKNEAAESATSAAESAKASATSAGNSADSAEAAANSATQASVSASGAAATLQEGQSILESTAEYARQVAQEAAGIHEAAIPAWDPETVYSYPTVVAYTDGNNYRCIGEEVEAGTVPPTSNAWVRITTISGDDFWEIDLNGGVQPRVNPTYAACWTLDADGNIEPRGLDDEITLAAETKAEQSALEAAGSASDAAGSAGEAAASALAAKNSEDHIDQIVTNATLIELDADDNITTKEEESEDD